MSLSLVQLFATPWTAAHQASLSLTNSQSLLKLMSTESVMPSNNLVLCHPLLLLPSTFPSIKVFSNKSVLLIRWLIFTSTPKYWSFSFNISPSVLPRTDFKGLSSLFQHHSSKTSVLLRSFPYGPTHTCGEIIIEIKKMISAKFRLPLVGKERAGPWWGRQVCHRDWFIVSSVK